MSLTKGPGGRASDGKIWKQVKGGGGEPQQGNPKMPRDTIGMKSAPSSYGEKIMPGAPVRRRSRENMGG